MPAVADELRPGTPGNFHTVAPLPFHSVQCCGGAGGMNRAFVEAAVLNQVVSRQERREAGKGCTKIRSFGDLVGPDAMQLNIEGAELHVRVHEGTPPSDCHPAPRRVRTAAGTPSQHLITRFQLHRLVAEGPAELAKGCLRKQHEEKKGGLTPPSRTSPPGCRASWPCRRGFPGCRCPGRRGHPPGAHPTWRRCA